MQLTNLNQEDVLQAAKLAFPEKYIEQDTCDFYLNDIETGKIKIDDLEHPFYVSTHYAYEDKLVNGNKTRYKVPLSLIYIKEDHYQVIYDSRGKCYVAYKENEIKFVLYESFYDLIKEHIHLLDEETK